MLSKDFEQQLTQLLRQEPFQHFVIERDDGQRFLVEKPSALMYQGGSSAVYFHGNGNIDFVDAEGVERVKVMDFSPSP